MRRLLQFILIASTLGFCWLAMQAVHELGHVTAAVVSGGRISKVVLHPATISSTTLSSDPHPLFVVWMGPVVGAALPLLMLAIARSLKMRCAYLAQFFAGFCLIANGAYLACGSFQGVGDAGVLLRHGTPIWLLWLFGVLTIPAGLWLWNGLGPHFGLGSASGRVDPVAAYTMLGMSVVVVTLELLMG